MTDEEKIQMVRDVTYGALFRYKLPHFLEPHKTNTKRYLKHLAALLEYVLGRKPTDDELNRASSST
jgi:hypothetical protein